MLHGDHPVARHCGVVHDLFVGDLHRTQILLITRTENNVKTTQDDDGRIELLLRLQKVWRRWYEARSTSETKYAKRVCFRDAFAARYNARVNKSICDHTLLPP